MTNTKQIVEVERREDRGKNACRRLRATGRVPANVYGLGLDPFAVVVRARRIDQVLHLASGRNTMLTLTMGGGEQSRDVMIRELQRHPITGYVTHVDFVRVDPTKRVQVKVPVRLIGTPEGVKNDGGILDFVHREVEVACLPSAIPEHFDLDVSGLKVNQHATVADLRVGDGVTLLEDAAAIIAVVTLAKAEEVVVAAPVEGETPAEPEVIKRGKDAAPEEEAKGR